MQLFRQLLLAKFIANFTQNHAITSTNTLATTLRVEIFAGFNFTVS